MIGWRIESTAGPTAAGDTSRAIDRVLPRIEIRFEQDHALVAPIWQRLHMLHGGGSLTTSWAWVETWLRHYSDIATPTFVIGQVDGIVVGCALLSRGYDARRGPVRLRTIHLGTAGEPDGHSVRVEYNRLLVIPRERDAFIQALLHEVQHLLPHDELRLDGMPPEEIVPFLSTLHMPVVDRRVSYVTDLRTPRLNNVSVESTLRKHSAAKIRRTRRRLEEEHGPIRTRLARSANEALEMLDELRALHAARWIAEGEPGAFASTRFNAFHEDLVLRLFDLEGVLLAKVTAGDITVGCDYGFIEHNRVLSYQWGLMAFTDKKLSPGLLVGAEVMQAAANHGLDEYDWLAGDVLYKRELSTAQRELIWARAPHGWRMRMLDRVATSARTVETAINRVYAQRPTRPAPPANEEVA